MFFAPQGLPALHYFRDIFVLSDLEYPRQTDPKLFVKLVVGVELGNWGRVFPQPFLIRLWLIEKFVNILLAD